MWFKHFVALGLWDPLPLGTQPGSPALAGRLFTIEPPGKPRLVLKKWCPLETRQGQLSERMARVGIGCVSVFLTSRPPPPAPQPLRAAFSSVNYMFALQGNIRSANGISRLRLKTRQCRLSLALLLPLTFSFCFSQGDMRVCCAEDMVGRGPR